MPERITLTEMTHSLDITTLAPFWLVTNFSNQQQAFVWESTPFFPIFVSVSVHLHINYLMNLA